MSKRRTYDEMQMRSTSDATSSFEDNFPDTHETMYADAFVEDAMVQPANKRMCRNEIIDDIKDDNISLAISNDILSIAEASSISSSIVATHPKFWPPTCVKSSFDGLDDSVMSMIFSYCDISSLMSIFGTLDKSLRRVMLKKDVCTSIYIPCDNIADLISSVHWSTIIAEHVLWNNWHQTCGSRNSSSSSSATTSSNNNIINEEFNLEMSLRMFALDEAIRFNISPFITRLIVECFNLKTSVSNTYVGSVGHRGDDECFKQSTTNKTCEEVSIFISSGVGSREFKVRNILIDKCKSKPHPLMLSITRNTHRFEWNISAIFTLLRRRGVSSSSLKSQPINRSSFLGRIDRSRHISEIASSLCPCRYFGPDHDVDYCRLESGAKIYGDVHILRARLIFELRIIHLLIFRSSFISDHKRMITSGGQSNIHLHLLGLFAPQDRFKNLTSLAISSTYFTSIIRSGWCRCAHSSRGCYDASRSEYEHIITDDAARKYANYKRFRLMRSCLQARIENTIRELPPVVLPADAKLNDKNSNVAFNNEVDVEDLSHLSHLSFGNIDEFLNNFFSPEQISNIFHTRSTWFMFLNSILHDDHLHSGVHLAHLFSHLKHLKVYYAGSNGIHDDVASSPLLHGELFLSSGDLFSTCSSSKYEKCVGVYYSSSIDASSDAEKDSHIPNSSSSSSFGFPTSLESMDISGVQVSASFMEFAPIILPNLKHIQCSSIYLAPPSSSAIADNDGDVYNNDIEAYSSSPSSNHKYHPISLKDAECMMSGNNFQNNNQQLNNNAIGNISASPPNRSTTWNNVSTYEWWKNKKKKKNRRGVGGGSVFVEDDNIVDCGKCDIFCSVQVPTSQRHDHLSNNHASWFNDAMFCLERRGADGTRQYQNDSLLPHIFSPQNIAAKLLQRDLDLFAETFALKFNYSKSSIEALNALLPNFKCLWSSSSSSSFKGYHVACLPGRKKNNNEGSSINFNSCFELSSSSSSSSSIMATIPIPSSFSSLVHVLLDRYSVVDSNGLYTESAISIDNLLIGLPCTIQTFTLGCSISTDFYHAENEGLWQYHSSQYSGGFINRALKSPRTGVGYDSSSCRIGGPYVLESTSSTSHLTHLKFFSAHNCSMLTLSASKYDVDDEDDIRSHFDIEVASRFDSSGEFIDDDVVSNSRDYNDDEEVFSHYNSDQGYGDGSMVDDIYENESGGSHVDNLEENNLSYHTLDDFDNSLIRLVPSLKHSRYAKIRDFVNEFDRSFMAVLLKERDEEEVVVVEEEKRQKCSDELFCIPSSCAACACTRRLLVLSTQMQIDNEDYFGCSNSSSPTSCGSSTSFSRESSPSNSKSFDDSHLFHQLCNFLEIDGGDRTSHDELSKLPKSLEFFYVDSPSAVKFVENRMRDDSMRLMDDVNMMPSCDRRRVVNELSKYARQGNNSDDFTTSSRRPGTKSTISSSTMFCILRLVDIMLMLSWRKSMPPKSSIPGHSSFMRSIFSQNCF